jgi:hypothetical protein
VAVEKFQLVKGGIDELLKSSGMHSIVEAEAENVRQRVEARGVEVERGAQRQPIPVEVEVAVIGDRVNAIVVLAHPAGLAAEAKYGLLAGSL